MIVSGSRWQIGRLEKTVAHAAARPTEERLRVASQRLLRLGQSSHQALAPSQRREPRAGLQQRLRRNRSDLRLRAGLRPTAEKHPVALFRSVALADIAQLDTLASRLRSRQAGTAAHRNHSHQEAAGGKAEPEVRLVDDSGQRGDAESASGASEDAAGTAQVVREKWAIAAEQIVEAEKCVSHEGDAS